MVRVPDLALEHLELPPDPLVVVIEGVEKPGNVGAALRSADGAGADALIAASPRTDLFNPNAIRASAGTVFAVPLAAAPSAEVLPWLRAHGLRIVAAWVDAERPYTEADLRGPIAIVLGAEATGLSDDVERPGRGAGRDPDAGRGRQPERVDQCGRAPVRGAPPAWRWFRRRRLTAWTDSTS